MSKVEQGKVLSPSEAKAFSHRAILPIAVVFFALQAIGTVIAIANKLPYEVGGQGDPASVGRDFLMGGGTALSGPLIVLVILAVLISLGRRHDRWGTLGLVGTIILGAMAAVFGVQEPIALRMLQTSPFGLFEAVVVILSWSGLLAVAAIVVLNLLVVIGRVRNATVFNRRSGSSQPM